MLKTALIIARLLTAVFWLGVLSTFALEWPAPLNQMIPWLGASILAVHGFEVLVWQKKIRMVSNNLMKDNLMVLIFGAFHMAQLSLEWNAQQQASRVES
ncbi:DUF1145 domain-containing protein [Parendozoicomonas haliclonae]|uniref:DUF1145 domain-containing protein n=1 Tax=Parendozoicomonas haliclonae TaxID=1960125 RepID=A0A1X7AR08_9GAMM|nr:DUF1145 domain-containing protein [Parendozoicomonas haliclonae]SMA50562.1 hypothetical protein EHSB41UT_04373 [Parendozoicomonas haliclonae]